MCYVKRSSNFSHQIEQGIDLDIQLASSSTLEISDKSTLETLKKVKNREAAARSRAKKLNKLLKLENTIKSLESENSSLSLQLAISESEKNASLSREEEYKRRIDKLELLLFPLQTMDMIWEKFLEK